MQQHSSPHGFSPRPASVGFIALNAIRATPALVRRILLSPHCLILADLEVVEVEIVEVEVEEVVVVVVEVEVEVVVFVAVEVVVFVAVEVVVFVAVTVLSRAVDCIHSRI